MSDETHDRKVARALINTAELGGYLMKKLTIADDMKAKIITIVFEASSSGYVQDALPLFQREPDQVATVDGTNGHLDSLVTQPGDLAETEAQANAEIAAAAEALPDAPGGEAPDPDEPRDPNAPLVGELAAAARKRR